MPDATKYREFIVEAYDQELHDESVTLITDLKKQLLAGEEMTSKAFEDKRKRLAALQDRAKEYGALVERESFKSDLELKTANDLLVKFVTEGKVKA